MPIPTRAAVLNEIGGEFEIEELSAPDPARDEIRVRVEAIGVCHSDESIRNGAFPGTAPIVLGHEGAGAVEAVGEGVDDVTIGDRVVGLGMPSCGDCPACQRGQAELCERSPQSTRPAYLLRGDQRVPCLSALGFTEYATVPRRRVVKVDTAIPWEQLCLVGCAVTTGVGAVLNAGRVKAGDSVAVVGCGGVGQASVQGARLAGASPVIAIDVDSRKIAATEKVGATHGINARVEDVVETVRALTGGRGVDVAVEAIGTGQTMRVAWDITRPGGTCVAVGIGGDGEFVVDPTELTMSGRTLVGSVYGSGPSGIAIPRLTHLAGEGRIDLASMVSRTFSLSQIGDAFEAMRSGDVVRAVVILD